MIHAIERWWYHKLWGLKVWRLHQTRDDYIVDILGVTGIILIVLGAIGIISKGLG